MDIIVDGRTCTVTQGDNLLHACLSLGFDLPYFCWHPALGSVGACRQCAVTQYRDADDRHGRIVMACMTQVAPGMRIAIAEPQAAAFRAGVIEWLMTNHPHDCPVCPEGGECHLQDMTVMTGHVHRRYRFAKRTHRNQYLGPFIQHEMNRCIACYRCVRFYRDYAGGRDFDVFATHRDVYFGRHRDGVLESEFSGNLVEVCPTGVFTDKLLDHAYSRKWDLRGAPSVCAHCGLGCNTTPNERQGTVRRVLNRYNGDVNGWFLCDRGRFGHGAAPLRAPLLDGRQVARGAALDRLGTRLAGTAIGIGSPRASVEANFALRRLVGAERFHLGLSAAEHRLLALIRDILVDGPSRAASIADCEDADAILVLGEDLPDTAPRLALALRQAVRGRSFAVAAGLGIPRWQDAAIREAAGHHRTPLFIATPFPTRLDDVASATIRLAPDDIARLGFAVAHALDPTAPTCPADRHAAAIAHALAAAERPLVVAGTGCGNDAIIQAAANVAWARRAGISLVVPECNSLGLALMGGGTLAAAFDAVAADEADTVIVLENDLYRRAGGAAVDRCLDRAHVVVLDHLHHDTAAKAEIVLPAATVAESGGTLVSNEGRAQRFLQVYLPGGDVRESWRWLGGTGLDDVIEACAQDLPRLAGMRRAAPSADFRIHGARIPRAPHRASGRAALDADVTLREPKPPDDPDSPLSFSMEGYYGPAVPPPLLPFAWTPGWNSVQAINKFQQEIGGPLRGGDPGVRLIEPRPDAQPRYFAEVPAPFAPRPDAWLVVPAHEVFGSEELSRLAPAVAERVPAPYLIVGATDLADGDFVTLSLTGATWRGLLRIVPAMPAGIAGLFDPSLAFLLPSWGKWSCPSPS